MNTKTISTGLHVSALAFAVLNPITLAADTPQVTTLPASSVTNYQAVLNGQLYTYGQKGPDRAAAANCKTTMK